MLRLTLLLRSDRAKKRFRAWIPIVDLKVCRLKRRTSDVTSNSLNLSYIRRLSSGWIIPKWTASVAIVIEAY